MTVSVYIPTNSVRVFPFLHTLSAFIVCRLFDDGHSDWCEVISYCSFDLHFSIMSNVEHLFMCLLAICMSSLEKCLFRSFSNSLIRLFIFLVLSCMISACIFWKLILCQLFHLLSTSAFLTNLSSL